MKAAFLSHTAMGGDFVVGSHHLAASLAARGHEVLHVSAPVTPAHLLRLRDAFVRRRLARWWRGGSELRGVRDIVPFSLLPWPLARRGRSLLEFHAATMLASRSSRVASLRLNETDCLIVDEPRLAGLAAPGPRMLAYRATDLYAQMSGDSSILAVERDLCRRADVLIGTSEGVAAHLRSLSGRPVHVIGNGVEYDHFAAPHDTALPLPAERESRAIYVGAFDHRFSAPAVRAAALTMPRKHFLLAGPGGERVAAALGLPNIHALGAIDYRNLPALLGSCAVGLLPFSESAANAGRSPMKLYEYAAAGLCVAATSSLRAGSSPIPTLCCSRTDAEFPAAVAQAFERAGDGPLVERARALARAEDWSAKASELLRLLQPATARSAMLESASLAPPVAASGTWS
jgi:teichuronic acid biosynthesis glycosyltransferase TuaH